MDSWIDERFLEVSPITLPFPERGGDSERAAFPGTNTPIIMKAPLLSFPFKGSTIEKAGIEELDPIRIVGLNL